MKNRTHAKFASLDLAALDHVSGGASSPGYQCAQDMIGYGIVGIGGGAAVGGPVGAALGLAYTGAAYGLDPYCQQYEQDNALERAGYSADTAPPPDDL